MRVIVKSRRRFYFGEIRTQTFSVARAMEMIKCAVFSIHTLRQAKFIRFSFTPHAHDSCSCRTVSEARSGRAGDVRLMSERDDSTLYGSSWLQNARVRSTACRSV